MITKENFIIRYFIYIRNFIDMLTIRFCILNLIVALFPFFFHIYKELHYAILTSEKHTHLFDLSLYMDFVYVLLIISGILLLIKVLSHFFLTIIYQHAFKLLIQSSNTLYDWMTYYDVIKYTRYSTQKMYAHFLVIIRRVFLVFSSVLTVFSWIPFLRVLNERNTNISWNIILLALVYISSMPILYTFIIIIFLSIDLLHTKPLNSSAQMQYPLNISESTYIDRKKLYVKQNCKLNSSILEQDLSTLNGYQFEEFCASLLTRLNYQNVYVTPKGNDQGVDIVATINNEKYAIQCKHYHSSVGNKAVQEVTAGMHLYKCQKSMVITTNYFTRQARELANACNVVLWDKDILLQNLASVEDIPDEFKIYKDLENTSENLISPPENDKKTSSNILYFQDFQSRSKSDS